MGAAEVEGFLSDLAVRRTVAVLFSAESAEWRPLPPAHSAIASPEPRRSTSYSDKRYYGETPGRLRCGPQDGLVPVAECGGLFERRSAAKPPQSHIKATSKPF